MKRILEKTILAVSVVALPAVAYAQQAPQGVPFPSMLPTGASAPAQPGAPQRPGTPEQKGASVSLPASNQPMTLDNAKMDKDLSQAQGQAEKRLNGLVIGDGKLDSADTSGYQGELQQMSAIQRQIKLLQLRQQQADAAIKLWSTVYDPRKENDLARGIGPATDAASEEQAKQAAAKKEEEKRAADAAAAAEARKQEEASIPYPKVVSIVGHGKTLKATLLVPYVGEVNAKLGTALPGNRHVTSIDSENVYIRDEIRNVTLPLGFGDAVPLTPPVSANGAAARPAGTR